MRFLHRIRRAATLVLVTVLIAPAAVAQNSGQARYAAVLRACKAEVTRFCPAAGDAASGRNQAICLRPFRANLSLACRHAVRAALR